MPLRGTVPLRTPPRRDPAGSRAIPSLAGAPTFPMAAPRQFFAPDRLPPPAFSAIPRTMSPPLRRILPPPSSAS